MKNKDVNKECKTFGFNITLFQSIRKKLRLGTYSQVLSSNLSTVSYTHVFNIYEIYSMLPE